MERQGGKLEVEVKGATPEVVWSFLDFTGVDKVAPDVDSCSLVEGVAGEPGCTRLVSLKPFPGLEAGPDGKPFFSKEKLLTVDHEDFSITYEVTESNIELVGYAAKMKVVGSESRDSRIELSFEAESFGRWSRAGLAGFLLRNLKAVAEAIERAVKVGEP